MGKEKLFLKVNWLSTILCHPLKFKVTPTTINAIGDKNSNYPDVIRTYYKHDLKYHTIYSINIYNYCVLIKMFYELKIQCNTHIRTPKCILELGLEDMKD